MLKVFSGLAKSNAGGEPYWPLERIEAALAAEYTNVTRQEAGSGGGPLVWLSCEHRNLQFLIGVLQKAPGSGHVIELGFFAIFQGVPFSAQQIDMLNGSLNIAVISREADDNLYLMAGLSVTGSFDEAGFKSLLTTWNRDIVVAIHHLSQQTSSLADAFLISEADAAVKSFALNKVDVDQQPEGATTGSGTDFFARFLDGGTPTEALCIECDGRGKRGVFARQCPSCDGAGVTVVR